MEIIKSILLVLFIIGFLGAIITYFILGIGKNGDDEIENIVNNKK